MRNIIMGLLKQITVIGCILCVHVLISPVDANRRVKRIFNGIPLANHDVYNTHYVVKLQQTFYCTTNDDEYDHLFADCSTHQRCGGSLVAPDFVLTACHCITFEEYYSQRIPIPPPRKLTYADLPKFIDVRNEFKPLEADVPIVYPKTTVVKHPLLNSMTIFAGNIRGVLSPQKRHAAKFFPHHLCTHRQNLRNPEDWDEIQNYYEMDMGLVKTCFPFTVNDDVQLAPIPDRRDIEDMLRKILHQNSVCLFVGWGDILKAQEELTDEELRGRGYGSESTDNLHHAFRVVECTSECYVDDSRCIICSKHFGPVTSSPAEGDSGGPLICEGWVQGVASRSNYFPVYNHSLTMFVAIACVREFLSDEHLGYLRGTADDSFHWFNGRPIPTPKPTTAKTTRKRLTYRPKE